MLKDFAHYISLILIFVFGVLVFNFFAYDRVLQASVAAAVSGSYIVWGVVHHALHKDLYLSVVIEYVIFASLGLIIILSLLFRA